MAQQRFLSHLRAGVLGSPPRGFPSPRRTPDSTHPAVPSAPPSEQHTLSRAAPSRARAGPRAAAFCWPSLVRAQPSFTKEGIQAGEGGDC